MEQKQMYPQLQNKQQSEAIQGMQLKYPDIFLDSFTALIVGKPNSGKSYLLEQLLVNDEFYRGKFQKIFFITPSPYEQINMEEGQNWNKKLDILWIFNKLKDCEKLALDFKQRNRLFNILFVFDDCVSEINKLQHEPFLQQLFLNRRHLVPNTNVSHFIVTQKYNLCPLKLRTQLDACFFFSVNQDEWNAIKKEIVMQNAKETKLYMNQIFKEPHAFIYINVKTGQIYNRFKKLNYISDMLI